jgi:DNA repair ATPase RecN
MDHTIDEVAYNRISRDKEFVLKEWQKIAAYLDRGGPETAQRQEMEQLKQTVAQLTRDLEAAKKKLDESREAAHDMLTELVTEVLAPAMGKTRFQKKVQNQT